MTRSIPRGQPLTTKINAVLLHLSGMSMHRLACLVRGSAQSVLNWSRAVATAYDEKPAPPGRRIVLARDEMWHDVPEKRQKLWIWKARDWETGQRLDWACGRRGKATVKQMVDRLARGDVKL